MIRLLTVAAIVAVPVAAALARPVEDEGLARWKANTQRHQQAILHGVPAPYAGIRDASPDSEAKLRRGRTLFDQHCASCHGWSGEGTGPEGFYLVPAPADLGWLARSPKKTAEGGKAFDSEMPAFKHQLGRQDRWALTAYIRNGMPRATP